MRAVAGDGDQQESVQMLQRAARRAAGEPAPPKLQEVLPIAWVHVPKCGSSFVNTLIHLPSVCSSGIPADLVVDSSTYGGRFLREFKRAYPVSDLCPGLMTSKFGHNGIDEVVGYDEGKGHFMIMMRQPEQRIISAYGDMVNAAMTEKWFDPAVLTDIGRSWGGWPSGDLPPLPEFAEKSRGCTVRMLTRKGAPCGPAGGPPSESEVSLAKERLRQGFAFVGLTDHWELSMCLFNAMFKTGCHSWQFGSARQSNKGDSSSGKYDLEQLHGVTDPFDGELFAEAVKLFEARLKQYNVSEASCAPCFQAAGISLASKASRVFYEDES